MKKEAFNTKKGFSLVEALLASSLFALILTFLVGAWLYGQEGAALAGERARAVLLAEEGLEAVRTIRGDAIMNLPAGVYGLRFGDNEWELTPEAPDEIGIFSREIRITNVGLVEREVKSVVSWQQNAFRSGEVTLTTRFTDWQKRRASRGGGGGGGSAPVSSCNTLALSDGYEGGICRATEAQCTGNDEDYLSGGDQYCTEGPSADTCCGYPSGGGGGGAINSCNAYAVDEGYSSGVCRANTNQCTAQGEDYLSGGDQYCTGGVSADTCCALP